MADHEPMLRIAMEAILRLDPQAFGDPRRSMAWVRAMARAALGQDLGRMTDLMDHYDLECKLRDEE